MLPTFTQVVQALRRARGIVLAYPLAACACSVIIYSLLLGLDAEASSFVVHHLYNIKVQPLLVGILSPYELRQVVEGRLSLSKEVSSIMDWLLPRPSGPPRELKVFEWTAVSYLIWTAAQLCTPMVAKLLSVYTPTPPSRFLSPIRRRRDWATFSVALLVLIISSTYPSIELFETFAQSGHMAVHYVGPHEYCPPVYLKCQMFQRVILYKADEDMLARILDLYLALEQAVRRMPEMQGGLRSFLYCVGIVISLARNLVAVPATIAAPVALDPPPHSPSDCEFCAGMATPRKVSRV
ncbi:hypothetical protein JCM9279_003809 [Rhodotorula babjevae]